MGMGSAVTMWLPNKRLPRHQSFAQQGFALQRVQTQSTVPVTRDEWLGFLQSRLAKIKHQVGTYGIPNALYKASGSQGQLQLAHLLVKVLANGPPMSWHGGLMWAAPRKPNIPLSPLNSRALFCADHNANYYSAAIRKIAVP